MFCLRVELGTFPAYVSGYLEPDVWEPRIGQLGSLLHATVSRSTSHLQMISRRSHPHALYNRNSSLCLFFSPPLFSFVVSVVINFLVTREAQRNNEKLASPSQKITAAKFGNINQNAELSKRLPQ